MLLNILMLMIIYAVLELKDMFVRVNKPVAEE
jgi:hypothetical protein